MSDFTNEELDARIAAAREEGGEVWQLLRRYGDKRAAGLGKQLAKLQETVDGMAANAKPKDLEDPRDPVATPDPASVEGMARNALVQLAAKGLIDSDNPQEVVAKLRKREAAEALAREYEPTMLEKIREEIAADEAEWCRRYEEQWKAR